MHMLQSLFSFLSDDCCTCFGYHHHSSSGAQNMLLKMGENDTRNMYSNRKIKIKIHELIN